MRRSIAHHFKRLKKFLRSSWIHTLFALPDNFIFFKARAFFLRPFFGSLGKDVLLSSYVNFNKPQNVIVGDETVFSRGVLVICSGTTRISFGRQVLVGPYTVIRSDDHVFERTDLPIRLQGHAGEDIRVEDDCWIGAHVTVLKGVTIGRGSVIGAGSVVTKDVPAFSVAVGCPARVIKTRGQNG